MYEGNSNHMLVDNLLKQNDFFRDTIKVKDEQLREANEKLFAMTESYMELSASISAHLKTSAETMTSAKQRMQKTHRSEHDSTAEQNLFQYGNSELCELKLGLLVDEDYVKLTKKEYDVLQLLLIHQDRVVSRDELHGRVWEGKGTLRVTDDIVKRLRSKLEDSASDMDISTVWGVGFRMTFLTKKNWDAA